MINEYNLSLILSKIEEHPNPKFHLEQYSITPGLAAHILFLIKENIENKIVCDLGCGTGRFAIGSVLIGAKKVYGVDIDKEVIEIAKRNVKYLEIKTGYKISEICEWVIGDVRKLKLKVDTVVQFPPLSLNEIFFRNAIKMAYNVYSIHESTNDRLDKLRDMDKNFEVSILKKMPFKRTWKKGERTGNELILVHARKIF